MNALAIDLGGSHATCAVVRDGSILASQSLAADGGKTFAEMLPLLSTTLHELLGRAHVNRADCAGLVLGFCGIVNARQKRVLATNKKFDDAPGLDLSQWCRTEFQLPFLIENDARLALLGEQALGAGRDAQDVVMVTLGSGIGGAAMLGGKLLQSRHGLAGTIGGHLPVVLDGRLCSCGNRGCAESEAATAFLGEIYRDQAGSSTGALSSEETISFAELFEAADAGDRPATKALGHCLRVWSVLTVALIHAYDPEVVVFGGSVLKRAAQILPHVQEYVNAYAWTSGRTVPVRAALLGSDAALLGATSLIEMTD